MATKTLFYLLSDKYGGFDGSVKATPVTLSGDTRSLGTDAGFRISQGFIDVSRNKELDALNFFTIEATINIDRISGRQNIVEAQSPAIALYVEADGKIVGAINTSSGMKKVDSGTTAIKPNSQAQVRFSRSQNGDMELEINDKTMGKTKVIEPIKNTGSLGFRIGRSPDGTQYQFQGSISNVRIARDGINAQTIAQVSAKATKLETKIKQIFKLERVLVNLNPDVSYSRLQPIKDIMNAAGVKKLSDLETLQIKTKTVMTRGKIVVAPAKSAAPKVTWQKVATQYFQQPSVAEKRTMLATLLPNKNSVAVLKKLKTVEVTTAPVTSTNVVGSGGRITGLGRGDTTRTGIRLPATLMAVSPTLRLARQPALLSNVIKTEGPEPKIANTVVLENLQKNIPANWPALGTVQAQTYSFNTIPINSAVLIASTLDLTNTELVVEPDVETLYIIAEKVICGANAQITWRRPGGSTPARLDNPDLNGRGWSGVNTKPGSRDGLDGEDGRTGETGIGGAPGINAPNLEMWVKDMTAMPNLDLNGEDGIKGGRGQRGGRGGNGADGHVGKRYWLFGWHCSEDPGDGGDGGNGGNGGRGGKGGNGGNGGKITIAVLEDTLENTVTSKTFKIKNQLGRKGRGGDGGAGGAGGWGGRSGVGETCKDADNGHNGAQGQPGQVGSDGTSDGKDGVVEFLEFSEEAWEELLERPWVSEVSPRQVFPGDTITLRGSSFTANDKVIIGNLTVMPVINADESVSAVIPLSITGGAKDIYMQRKDGSQSNRQQIWIKPQLNPVSGGIAPGSTVTLSGKAFLPGASVLVHGDATPANVLNANSLNFTMPGTGGGGNTGGDALFQVRNPDGMLSNSQTLTILGVLEIPFKYGVHNLSFGNFTDGIPSWSTYEDTFGAAEIWHEQLDPIFGHPILTAAFYGFYYYFLEGEANGGLATGFCTSLASLVAEKFWTGATDATTITKASVHKMLTAVHGKLLSRESLIHFHDQSQDGVARVEKTYREIEFTFLNGIDRNNAPLLFFIPSGAIWDSGYIDKLGKSHCIMPYRFVYPKGVSGPQLSADGATTVTDPDGVEMYCWDCNHPTSPNCKLVFKRIGGQIHYEYYPDSATAEFKSTEGITLGMMRHGQFMLADHDLPFSGPLGLTTFIIDFLLSPAELQVTDENGLRTGNFGAQILAEIPNSHPGYLIKGAYMLPADRALTRKIIGKGSGKYTYNSIMPNGKSLVLEDVQTEVGHEDLISVNADATQIRFTPSVQKDFTATLSTQIGDEVRSIAVKGIGGGPAADVDITVAPDLSLMRVGNSGAAKTIEVKAFFIEKVSNKPVNNQKIGINLPTKSDLVIAVPDWKTADLKVDVVSFE